METLNIDNIYSSINNYDVFICSSSFEDRCLEIASKLNISQFKHVIICHFEDNYSESDNNLLKLKDLFNNKCNIIILSKDNPLRNYDDIFDKLSGIEFNKALLDISTFTREIFLIIIKLFYQQPFNHKSLTICYNPSNKYSLIPEGNINDLWLSKGVSSIRSIIGYAGDISPIKDNMLIVLVGFEAERSQILIDSFEPEKLYIGCASKEGSVNDDIAAINAQKFKILLNQNTSANSFAFSCKNLDTTKQELINIIEQNKEKYNIIISPMNNKISTLAVVAITFKYPEVQVCYAATNMYNTIAYSTPADHIYVIDVAELYNA